MFFYIIYKITNQINGKYYIGRHATKDVNDSYMGSGIGIKNAINKHGVKNFTKEIIATAKQQAEQLIANAEKECADRLTSAEQDAAALTERSVKTIKQAGRDLLILLGQSCEKVISSSLQHSVGDALSTDLLKDLIKKSISGESGSIEIAVNESEVKALTSYCAELAAESGADQLCSRLLAEKGLFRQEEVRCAAAAFLHEEGAYGRHRAARGLRRAALLRHREDRRSGGGVGEVPYCDVGAAHLRLPHGRVAGREGSPEALRGSLDLLSQRSGQQRP